MQRPLLHRFFPSQRSALRAALLVSLAFAPALALVIYWFAEKGAMIVLCALLPVVYLVPYLRGSRSLLGQPNGQSVLDRPAFEAGLEEIYQTRHKDNAGALLLCLAIEDHEIILSRHGAAAMERLVERVGARLTSVLRREDHVAYLGEAQFAICIVQMQRLDLENAIQLANRLQATLEDAIDLDGLSLYLMASLGFCQITRTPDQSSAAWLEAAQRALSAAQRAGPGAIRAFSTQMAKHRENQETLHRDVTKALKEGQITPWFQPQISTDTGQVTGFEALARWAHPDHGMISPAEFLPAIEETGQLEHLADVMIAGAFAALKRWDQSRIHVPKVGVNFAGPELNNPRLTEKIKWELDRFELNPERLAVEVLETVVSNTHDDMVTRNINALGKLGCCIDLDDFGTGQASIASIKRFSVSRIKIDRSFVMKADRDPDQQRMISAILTMAEQLQIETLAEGVETAGEHALLAQLGCGHVQGFGIARPMPSDQTIPWMMDHQKKLEHVPRLIKGKGA